MVRAMGVLNKDVELLPVYHNSLFRANRNVTSSRSLHTSVVKALMGVCNNCVLVAMLCYQSGINKVVVL